MEALRVMATEQAKTLEAEIKFHQKEIGKKQKELNALYQIITSSSNQEENKEKEESPDLVVITDAKNNKRNKNQEKDQHSQVQSSTTFDDEERAKTFYVIFTGANRGIYDHWSKAAPFIVGHNVIHKKFLSLQEAKLRLEEYKNTYAGQIQTSSSEAKRKGKLVSLGTIPTIFRIQTREQKQESTKLTREKFDKNFVFLTNYKDEDKTSNIYPTALGGYTGPKGVALPEADPHQVYMMFQSGLIHTIYFNGDRLFQYFPSKLQFAIKTFISKILHDREGFIRCFGTYPYFSEGGEEIQSTIQLCQIGISNNNYPDINIKRSEEEREDILEDFLNNYTLILNKGIKIKGRINYSAKSIILWSQQTREPSIDDIKILSQFLERLIKNEYSFNQDIKEALCERLTKEYSEDHVCEICTPHEDIPPVQENN